MEFLRKCIISRFALKRVNLLFANARHENQRFSRNDEKAELQVCAKISQSRLNPNALSSKRFQDSIHSLAKDAIIRTLLWQLFFNAH